MEDMYKEVKLNNIFFLLYLFVKKVKINVNLLRNRIISLNNKLL